MTAVGTDGHLSSPAEVARAYSTLWLAAAVREAVCQLLAHMFRVSGMSASGCRQLCADIGETR